MRLRAVAVRPEADPVGQAAGALRLERRSFVALACLSAFGANADTHAPVADAAGAFSFVLPRAQTTSAAVYTPAGRLLRTLWRGEPLAAGRHLRHWDGADDRGQPLPAGRYQVRLLAHNVSYHWDGVIGNSASRAESTSPHRSFLPPTSLIAETGRLLYAVGYNEGQSGIHGFALAQPQIDQSPLRHTDPFISVAMLASDGERLYWANHGGLSRRHFIAAFDLVDERGAVLKGPRPHRFAQGQAVCLNRSGSGDCYPDQSYASVLALRDPGDALPSGLAVQARGRLLAVAYGVEGAIRLFDKLSGALLRVLPLAPELTLKDGPSINAIAFAPDGDLWVLGAHQAQRIGGLEAFAAGSAAEPRVLTSVAGLSRPLAITVDAQDADAVWIADGGASQQLKRFDRQGRAGAVIGRLGGLRGQAEVGDDRLSFAFNALREQTALAVDSQRALWVVDTGHNRILKFAPGGQVPVDQIAYLPASYSTQVDTTQPNRVFANFLEFAVDHRKPLTDPLSWTLVRNWLAPLRAVQPDLFAGQSGEAGNLGNLGFSGFRSVQTLANGRTYAVLAGVRPFRVVELMADGRVRLARTLRTAAPNETDPVLYEGGDLGYAVNTRTLQTRMRQPLRGFDADGNPVWATLGTPVASVPLDVEAPAHPLGTAAGNGPRFPLTDSGRVIFFNPAVGANTGQHLGAVEAGAKDWLWQASPSGPMDGRGAFQTQRDDPRIQYGGNVVWASGRDLVYGYHGEFYTELADGPFKGKVGQAHQFMHFRDDGLFIGQFGLPSTRLTGPFQPGAAGNAFSPTLVRVDGRLFLLHNDEWGHGGVHRWRIDGLDSVQDRTGTLLIGSTGATGSSAEPVELR